jgi:hypothetical protein
LTFTFVELDIARVGTSLLGYDKFDSLPYATDSGEDVRIG